MAKNYKHSLIEIVAFSPLITPVVYLFGNKFGQQFLEFLVHCAQHLMGIGSGSSVRQSGEHILPKLCQQYCEKPIIIVDVGVNEGEFVDLFLTSNLDVQQVHGFEPSDYCFNLLQKKYAQSLEVQINRLALSDENCEAVLFSNELGSGSASLMKPKFGEKAEAFSISEKILVSTLDLYCEQHSIDHISLLKIDVEGYDLNVLRGALGMISKSSVDIITFEFCAAAIETRIYFRDFFEFLTRHGFGCFRLTRSGYIYPIEGYSESHETFRTTNFVAIRTALIK